MNKDKICCLLMLIVIAADIVYMAIWSISKILNVLMIMWVLVMTPTIIVYLRGDGTWKIVDQ